MSNFSHTSCGETIPPKNVHAVSVSMPTMKDVISYENGENNAIKSGYPRFILHPYLKIIITHIKDKYSINNNIEVILVSSIKSKNRIIEKYNIEELKKFNENFGIILINKNSTILQEILKFIQQSGCNLSSRFAQTYLHEKNLIKSLHVENKVAKNIAKKELLSTLSLAYEREDIYLTSSGMNAMYSVLKAVQKIKNGLVIQLGWLYLDNMKLIEQCSSQIFLNVEDLEKLEVFLENYDKKISCIVTEIPTNPLLQSVDIKKLKNICIKYDIILVIDSTLATSFNKISEADILIESLTKFACGNGDVLMGCFALSKNYKKYEKLFIEELDEPYIEDIQRLAYEIRDYHERVKHSNANREKLVKFLQNKRYIKKIYHSCLSPVISITFTLSLDKIYDKLNFYKGPSLGTRFTLLMPYVYLAHYDLINSAKGRKTLANCNIPIDLLRISIGTEDIEKIKDEFNRVELLI